MSERDSLSGLLHKLAPECGNSKDFRTAIEMLIEIHRNLFTAPDNEKFRRLKLNGKRIRDVYKYRSFRNFLNEVGWKVEDESLVLVNQANDNFKSVIDVLQEFRLVSPDALEWVEDNKVVNLTAGKEREEKLRAEAAKVREKELEKCFADKKEREALAANIKKQILADIAERKHRVFVPPEAKRKMTSPVSYIDGEGKRLGGDDQRAVTNLEIHGKKIQ